MGGIKVIEEGSKGGQLTGPVDVLYSMCRVWITQILVRVIKGCFTRTEGHHLDYSIFV